MKKIIELKHHLDDYECMWNGIEDLYIEKTDEVLPPNFFFVLSGFGSFCYLKTPKADLKRMVALGDGRTKKMYEFLAPIVGFDYKHFECSSFEKALKNVKKEIDCGFPCVLGALDMYYLPYFTKLYHNEHIPFHYVLMIGYNDEEKCIYLYDCGRKEMMTLSYDLLQLAWDCSYPGLSKPFTYCKVRYNNFKSKYDIAKEALQKRKEFFLTPPTNFLGYYGFEKFIKELKNWKNELTKEEYDAIFENMVQFLGTVPTIPNALRGIDKEDDMKFGGGFDKASLVLKMIGEEYHNKSMIDAAIIFKKGVEVTTKIKDIIVDYLIDKDDQMTDLPDLFYQIANIMKEGYEKLNLV